MPRLHRCPGPAAATAFSLGLAATAGGFVALVVLLFVVGALGPAATVVALLAGLPVVTVVAACVLSTWLGYREDALARVLASASEE